MKTIIIVQARMTSTRLPGKILKTVLDKPLLEYQIERLRRVKLANEIVIATTINETDQPVVEFCERLAIPYYRGSEEDVLARYYEAAIKNKADVVVRVTSDCPMIDPDIINSMIDYYLHNHLKYDYVSNSLKRTYPRGMDTEVFSFLALKQAFQESTAQAEREHVTPFIYLNPERYHLASIEHDQDYSKYRLTVDTQEDYELISHVIKRLYANNPTFSLADIVRVLEQNPEWYLINAHIEQKKIGE